MLYSFSLAVLSLRFTHFLGRRYRFFTINMNYEVLQNLLLGLDGERHKHKINSFYTTDIHPYNPCSQNSLSYLTTFHHMDKSHKHIHLILGRTLIKASPLPFAFLLIHISLFFSSNQVQCKYHCLTPTKKTIHA